MAHDLKSSVCDHLICIHICSCTSTSLDHVHRKLVMVLTLKDLITRLHNGSILLICEKSKLVVGNSCTDFCHCESVDEQRVVTQMETADRKILDTTKSLHSV